jgi:hypothetical protein
MKYLLFIIFIFSGAFSEAQTRIDLKDYNKNGEAKIFVEDNILLFSASFISVL